VSLTIAAKGATDSASPPQRDITGNLEKLSSGNRTDAAAADAADLAVSQRLDLRVAAFSRGVQNASDGVSVLRVAEGGLSEIAQSVTRMRELAADYGNGALGASEREALQAGYDAAAETVTALAQTTEFNGRQLLDGETSGSGAVRLEDGNSGAEHLEISIESHTADSLGLEGLDLSDPDAPDKIDAALQQVTSTRDQLGSLESRVHSQIADLRQRAENTPDARSRIADLDLAQETAQQTTNQILHQLHAAVRGQANASAGVALQLLVLG
jgi:flagellin